MTLRNIIAVSALALSSTAFCTDFGYCTDELNRRNIYRMGATEKQGLAIRMPNEKLALLKGCSISGVKIAVGSSRTTGGTLDVFISRSPEATPLVTSTFSITGAVKWVEYKFDTPYVITGDEPDLYIGYTADISTQTSMLMSDFTADISGCAYIYRDGEWADTYGLGYGAPCIRLCIDGAPEITDLMIKPIKVNGYFSAGEACILDGQLFNFGNMPVTSFDINVSIDNGAPESLHFSGLDIAPGATYDVEFPQFTPMAEGILPVAVTVDNVNGWHDSAPADNIFIKDFFFYPEGMERSILLEGFTGQACSNCPSGHATIEAFMHRTTTPVIEVMHHSGYQPDMMTMDSDMDYTFFYGNPSTFAPAVMMNRTVFPSISSVPIMNLSAANLNAAYSAAETAEPYLSLGIESTFNPATREATVKVTAKTHVTLPARTNVLNLMLVQDGIIAKQTPYGEGYVHNCVFRGTLTGNSWGLKLDDAQTCAGGEVTWSTSFTLPEAIFSDYWASVGVTPDQQFAFSQPAVPENMRIVAYVGAFDSGNLEGHTIYNCVETRLGENYIQGGIASLPIVGSETDGSCRISVIDGLITVDGGCDNLQIYRTDGRLVHSSTRLTPGLYIVLVAKGGESFTKKIVIR